MWQQQTWKVHSIARSNQKETKCNETTEIKVLLLQLATGHCFCNWLLATATGYYLLTATATATGFCYCYWLLATGCSYGTATATCCKAGHKFVYPKFAYNYIKIKRDNKLRKGRGMGEKAKASLARNRSSKSIKPHKASMLTCLRCRVAWLLTMSNFDLWTLAICWRTLIYHSARYKCLGLAPNCGNKNSKLRFQRTRRSIKEWTANSNHIRLTYFTGKEKNNCLGSWHPSASALSALRSRHLESPSSSAVCTLHRYDMSYGQNLVHGEGTS